MSEVEEEEFGGESSLKPLHKLPTQPFEGTLLEKVTCLDEFFQLSVAMVNYLLIKIYYALNTKKIAKAPSHSWKRERRGGDGLFFLLFKKRKRESGILDVYALK